MPRAAALLVVFLFAGCAEGLSEAQIDIEAAHRLDERCRSTRASLANMPQADFDRFCACATEKSLAVLGAEGRRKFANDEPWSAADGENVKQATAQCMNEVLGS
jgi:hypothetical protein